MNSDATVDVVLFAGAVDTGTSTRGSIPSMTTFSNADALTVHALDFLNVQKVAAVAFASLSWGTGARRGFFFPSGGN